MKQSYLLTPLPNAAKRIPMGLGLVLAVSLLHLNATAQDVNLGMATNFAVLGGSGIKSTGPTVINGFNGINGNIGASPITGAAITGFLPGIVNGTIYTVNGAGPTGNVIDPGLLTLATGAFNTAYTQILNGTGLPTFTDLTGTVLGSLGTAGSAGSSAANALTPGYYHFDDEAHINGRLYLNDENLSDPIFVFQIGSALITASSSSIEDINAIQGSSPGISIFWQVGSSATLGTTTDFEGNILAYASITDNGGSTVDGRLLAGAAVTLNNTTVNVTPVEMSRMLAARFCSSAPHWRLCLPLHGGSLCWAACLPDAASASAAVLAKG